MLSSACLARHRSCAPPTLNQTAGGFGTEPWIQHVLEYCETINNEIKTDEMNVTIVVESQFTQLRSCLKKGVCVCGGGGGGGLQRYSNTWPLRSRCSAIQAEL